MKRSFSTLALALTIFASSAFVSAKETTVTQSETKKAYCCFKKAAKIVTPYILAIAFYKMGEKAIKDSISDEGYQNGAKEIVKCFTGLWIMDKVKNHAKYLEKLMGNPFDFEEEKATA